MTTAREQELLDEQARLRAELDAVGKALTEERFKDVPRLAEGTEVLVPRLLFGKRKWWPAKIASVRLSYTSGTDAKGEPWETKTVSYSVYLRQPNGEYGGSSKGYYHKEVVVPS